MKKTMKFCIRTEVDDRTRRRKELRDKNENFLFLFGRYYNGVNPLDYPDKKNVFDFITKCIVSDWCKIERATLLGLDYSCNFIIDKKLSSIIDQVLHDKFDENFIKNYDRKEHNYFFSVDVDLEKYELIKYEVEDRDYYIHDKEFAEDSEFDFSFLIRVSPRLNNPYEFRFNYRGIFGCGFDGICDVFEYRYGSKNFLDGFFDDIVYNITRDWYAIELRKIGESILNDRLYNSFFSSIKKIRLCPTTVVIF